MDKKKKFFPLREDPDDSVGTIYCGENTPEFRNIVNEDAYPYQSPLPQRRPRPEPPII